MDSILFQIRILEIINAFYHHLGEAEVNSTLSYGFLFSFFHCFTEPMRRAKCIHIQGMSYSICIMLASKKKKINSIFQCSHEFFKSSSPTTTTIFNMPENGVHQLNGKGK